MCELYAKIIAGSELLQPALNEIHKFCFQHWSRGRGTYGTGSSAPEPGNKSGFVTSGATSRVYTSWNGVKPLGAGCVNTGGVLIAGLHNSHNSESHNSESHS